MDDETDDITDNFLPDNGELESMEICWRLSLWNAGGDLLLSRSSGLLQSLDRPEASSDGECFPAVIGNDNTSLK
jgi:hypothetical protein